MTHGHVEGVLWQARDRADLEIVGVYEPNRALFDRLAEKYGLAESLWHDDLGAMLDATKPEAASVMNSIAGHVDAAEACAPRGVHMLFEKPLAFSVEDGERIAELSREYGVLALTNYETSWYGSVRTAKRLVDEGRIGAVRRIAYRHGHKGPREIGVYDEFSEWLTDPAENGGGAVVDFGCYGAVISTWLVDGRPPEEIEAMTRTLKPGVYPEVDDDSTIVLGYPGMTAVVQGSWAWTHDNKEMDIHGELGSLHAGRWDELWFRSPDGERERVEIDAREEHEKNEWTYLKEVVRGRVAVDGLSSLENNLVVVGILDEARSSW